MKQILAIITLLIFLQSCEKTHEKNIVVLTKTLISRHESIADGINLIDSLATKNNWGVVYTEDANYFTEENLQNIDIVVLLNSSGDVFNASQQADFQRFVQAGGGVVGVHAAATTEYDWPWFNQMMGAYFLDHPEIQEGTLNKTTINHASTTNLPEKWNIEDEWYNFRDISKDINLLLTLDENSITGGKNGNPHPISWHHEFDGGKVFYTNLGHRKETYKNINFISHLAAGLQSVMPEGNLDYTLATAPRVPGENRFKRTVLAQYLNEPMELDIAGDRYILIAERKGALKMYDLETDEMSLVNQFDVFVGFEEGLIGVAVDPNYEENSWIYLFYSENKGKPLQNVSRFSFKNGKLDLKSEKIILQVTVQREECCHVAGSLEFGPDGLLYIATGDNTNPFASNGYAPMDESPGRKAWDAQKSSANTNDLRGKILRIKLKDDGSYSIPEGNLFPPGTEKTRPEIYIMGLRNPFRIALDSKTGWLYWGDVGPDAGRDSPLRGPKGYDELNQAREAGFYGWPYTRGGNIPYVDYNFETKKSGEKFDPEHIINNSPNNTGLQELPPVQPSLIYYSYDKSELFPWTGTGGKNPMAGPVFHRDDFYSEAKTFPDFFEGKVFFYEWIRDWIFLIDLDEKGNFKSATPFLENMDFHNPMDMIFSKTGELYILEYGDGWFKRNPEARLNKIEYVYDNMEPVARIRTNKNIGGLPLTVQFDGLTSEDFDGDQLKHEWRFTGNEVQSEEAVTTFTFTKPGRYRASLTVTDPAGHKNTTYKEIMVGNALPEINLSFSANDHKYWNGREVKYDIEISDKEDGSNDSISLPGITSIIFQYLAEGEDLAALGHQTNEKPAGLAKIEGSDCKACHSAETKVNGPSYLSIAEKYSKDDTNYLVQKVINGGSGVWGETPMSAHPQLSESDVTEMVEYILSLGTEKQSLGSIAPSGTLTFDQHLNKEEKGQYVLQASYTDIAQNGIDAQTTTKTVYFTPNVYKANDFSTLSDSLWVYNNAVSNISSGSHFSIHQVNCDEIDFVEIYFSTYNDASEVGTIEIRAGSPSGEVLKSIRFNAKGYTETPIDLKGIVSGSNDLYFILKPERQKPQLVLEGVYISYQ